MAPGTDATPRERLIAIGNFDGVHLGHAHLVRRVTESARELSLSPCVLTFEPHPAAVLGHGAPRTLTRLERKLELLAAVSPELEVVVQPFDRELSLSSPRAFAEQLVRVHRARQVIVGENFRFGKDRAGDLGSLRALGAELGFEVGSTELLSLEGEVVSSSRIRDAIGRGAVEDAARLLGRPHRLLGRVVRGDGRGHGLGFPTANLADIEELLPQNGVYAVRVRSHGPDKLGVLNVGVRPTFAASGHSVEVHVLDLEEPLDPDAVAVDLVERLREERRFDGPAALAEQIGRDVAAARERLGSGREPE